MLLTGQRDSTNKNEAINPIVTKIKVTNEFKNVSGTKI